MSWWTFSKRRLMAESEFWISEAVTDGSESQRLAAERIVDDPQTYRIWEAQHARLMQRVANATSSKGQLFTMRSIAMSLIHRKAVFERIRHERVFGADRHAVFEFLYGPIDYANAVVTEHGHFIRASCSYYCATELGSHLLRDATFRTRLGEYEHAYDEYFSSYLHSVLPAASKRYAYDASYLPLLKQAVDRQRQRILSLPRKPELTPDGFELQDAQGDSIRLPALGTVTRLPGTLRSWSRTT